MHASAASRYRRRRARSWSLTKVSSFGFTALTVLCMLGMLALFARQSLPAWRHAGWDYPTGTTWFYRQEVFGALPMVYGTLAVAAVAVAVAAPIALGTAVCTAELLPARSRLLVKGALELLAGVPSVVYGLLGILFLRRWVYAAEVRLGLDPLSGDSLFTAGLLLGVMILPTVMTLGDDALRAVPGARRTAARGLGLTRAETLWAVSLPAAARGLAAALLLGLGRALGETIAVYLVVGRQDNQWPERWLSLRPLLEPGQTLSSKLGGSETNIAYGDPLHWGALVGLALFLFAIVGVVTLLGARLVQGGARDA